tara:strand:- start:9 stop:4139 length:4131 start_codon:yes stop_codon:yes gene_type:complete
MPTYHKVREDGRSLYLQADSPEEASRMLREQNLALRSERKQQEYKASAEYQPGETLEPENIEFGGKVLRGGLNGLVSIPTNITSAVGFGLQAAGAEEVGSDLVDRANAVRERFAPDIEGLGLAAEIPKALVQFGLPAGLVFKATKGANKATQIAATAAAEGLVAEEDMKTFGDTYLPNPLTKTQELEFLSGQERAFAALYNKGKTGLEAAAITMGVPLALTGAGAVIKTTSKVAANVPGVSQVADGLAAVGEGFGETVRRMEKSSPLVRKALSQVRFRGDLPDDTTAEIKSLYATNLARLSHQNEVAFKDLNTSLETMMKSGKENGYTQEMVVKALDDFINPMTDDYIDPSDVAALQKAKLDAKNKQNEAAKLLIEMDRKMGFVKSNRLNVNTKSSSIRSDLSLFRSAKRVRETIDEYSGEILNRKEYLPEGAEETIVGQMGLYNARQYRAFLSDNYEADPAKYKAALGVIKDAIVKSDPSAASQLTREQLDEMAATNLSLITQKGQFNNAKVSPEDLISDDTLRGVSRGPLRGRILQSKEIRDFLGEYTAKRGTISERTEGLLKGVTETLGRQSALIAKGKYFSELAEYNRFLADDAKMFVDNQPVSDVLKGSKLQEYIQVPNGPGYGRLAGKWVKKDYINAIEKNATSIPFENVPIVSGIYASMLGLKGISQLAKTVYNPTGQIRNATTAMGFAVANGNVPNGKTLSDAYQLLMVDLKQSFATEAGKKAVFDDLISKGLVGQQAQLRELEDLIEIASGKTTKIPLVGTAIDVAQGRKNKFASRLYRASDDFWRVANYMTERKKITGMIQSSQVKGQPFNMKATTIEQIRIARANGLDPNNVDVSQLYKKFGTSSGKVDEFSKPQSPTDFDKFVDAEAAMITRNVVPNYSRVPTLIQNLRMLPVGNFIAYPAEILRTSGNILGQSIKELASDNPYLRQRGMERLMGFGTMTTFLPSATVALGTSLTGSSQDQIEAYKRSGAFPWDKTGNIIPVRTDKDGNVLEVMNGSYTFPYDYLVRPYQAVMNAVVNGERKEETLSKIAFNAMTDASAEFFQPFLGESIITERVFDLLARGGRTRLGSEVYDPNDEIGDKLWAGTAHLFNGLLPVVSPVELNTKESLIKSTGYDDFTRSFRLGDLTQSVLVESQLLDPRYRVSEGGRQLDFFNELAQATTGVKTIKVDMERSLMYKAYEARSELASATEEFRAIKRAYGPRPPKEILAKFQQANERKYRAARDLSIAIDDARLLGVTNEKIAKVLSKQVGGIADWRALMNNIFIPYTPPPSVTVGAYEASETKVRNIVPLGQISDEIGRSMRDTKQRFSEPPAPQQRPAPLLERAGEAVQEAAESAPSLFNQATQRASQFLRQQEEEKLLGGS